MNDVASFVKIPTALPSIATTGKSIVVCDFDEDGLKEVFIGGRNTLGKYN